MFLCHLKNDTKILYVFLLPWLCLMLKKKKITLTTLVYYAQTSEVLIAKVLQMLQQYNKIINGDTSLALEWHKYIFSSIL